MTRTAEDLMAEATTNMLKVGEQFWHLRQDGMAERVTITSIDFMGSVPLYRGKTARGIPTVLSGLSRRHADESVASGKFTPVTPASVEQVAA